MTPFDFVNRINKNKDDWDRIEPTDQKQYIPFIINRTYSYFLDSILFANWINQYHEIPKKLQFKYYISSLNPRVRFTKWGKKTQTDDVDLVMTCYQYSRSKAEQAVKVLTADQLSVLREMIKTGGTDG